MSIKVALTHRTTYTYDQPVTMGPQVIRLRPAPHTRTNIISYSLNLEPKDHFLNWQQDPFGNFLARMVTSELTKKFSVTVDLVAEMASLNPFDFFIEEEARVWPFTYDEQTKRELDPYLVSNQSGPRLHSYMERVGFGKDARTLDVIVEINQQLEKAIDYNIRMEPGVQTPEETLQKASGSCRDTAWLLVHILRKLGLAARFVSGYLIQLKPDIAPLEGPVGASEDFTDLHAWAEVYLPGAGWVGLDPTSGLLASEGHIPLAATPNPSSASPITGAHDKADVEFDFEMKLERIFETPRVTKPYTDTQWQAILSLGDKVDERLSSGDVRLTMGGEPTFVSATNMEEGGEWNNQAVGPTKRRYAEDLVRRLTANFAPGGLMHFGQGKWYPGEQLPRWAFAAYWRRDGKPLWRRPDLIDTEHPKKAAEIQTANLFASELCAQLGLPSDSGIPAYEDAAHFALVEQKLPLNLTPGDNKLDDEEERARVIKAFENGLSKPVSYVLPIQAWQTADMGRRWATEKWQFRRGALFLNPGNSPAGFRLPLGALSYIAPNSFPHVFPEDPIGQKEPLPDRETLLRQRRIVTLEAPPLPMGGINEISGSVRTAMAIEPRDGHLCIFMPPIENAADYAALVAAIEETAAKMDQPVHIEGYEPPFDTRLNVIKVTPDPGVIEVNIHPAKGWRESVSITEDLYEAAHFCRLGTEKFMIDGRHSGTGGGNHIVLGGTTPSDSPFLRRPDLLASVITYWQHHPSLSYLFSGQFIGPTSQSPRVDEARHEGLYELEIALGEVPGPEDSNIPLWLVDRLFRNLLIDVTGNTHRAEICIDKLYSPDGPSGRLGLIEFRSFEMPPHARMSLAQQLLLRALIARFWDAPYKAPLIRWGTDLHDRFMLPHFVWRDFLDVLSDLRAHGLDFQESWFEPHFEFRFPQFGKVTYDDVAIELRGALEPWHVMGEQGVIGGTARYVDSSLERLQVKVTGLAENRYVLVCGGKRVPLAETGIRGEGVAGIRFRAWQPPMCLHPTIGIHTPLVFDIVDSWTGRALGGCRYHVAHPGGKYFDTVPINAFEAEGRRHARFEPFGHSPGPLDIPQTPKNPDYPYTLDLRKF